MPEKYKDEIEEILRNAGEASPNRQGKEPERRPEGQPKEFREPKDSKPATGRRIPMPDYRRSPQRLTLTPGKIMLAGVITLLIGIKLWPLIWIGLAMLAGAYLMHFMSPRSVSYEKRWRGRSVEDVPDSDLDASKHRGKK